MLANILGYNSLVVVRGELGDFARGRPILDRDRSPAKNGGAGIVLPKMMD